LTAYSQTKLAGFSVIAVYLLSTNLLDLCSLKSCFDEHTHTKSFDDNSFSAIALFDFVIIFQCFKTYYFSNNTDEPIITNQNIVSSKR